ncbi:hypothetical protein ACFQ1L_34375 [Phytohabitans flavus]|uniref:Uncharacterized protein n=1 Tax=Phytohabitans flavus TaxID=1076124 RepID=A0A6F8XM11_9ACTN|nr:hypothetical protein [Phytohabitans flavus]BCB74864.1 hypothetical protein Pflav_012740 [Phytohabitans flavus]
MASDRYNGVGVTTPCALTVANSSAAWAALSTVSGRLAAADPDGLAPTTAMTPGERVAVGWRPDVSIRTSTKG